MTFVVYYLRFSNLQCLMLWLKRCEKPFLMKEDIYRILAAIKIKATIRVQGIYHKK